MRRSHGVLSWTVTSVLTAASAFAIVASINVNHAPTSATSSAATAPPAAAVSSVRATPVSVTYRSDDAGVLNDASSDTGSSFSADN